MASLSSEVEVDNRSKIQLLFFKNKFTATINEHFSVSLYLNNNQHNHKVNLIQEGIPFLGVSTEELKAIRLQEDKLPNLR